MSGQSDAADDAVGTTSRRQLSGSILTPLLRTAPQKSESEMSVLVDEPVPRRRKQGRADEVCSDEMLPRSYLTGTGCNVRVLLRSVMTVLRGSVALTCASSIGRKGCKGSKTEGTSQGLIKGRRNNQTTEGRCGLVFSSIPVPGAHSRLTNSPLSWLAAFAKSGRRSSRISTSRRIKFDDCGKSSATWV